LKIYLIPNFPVGNERSREMELSGRCFLEEGIDRKGLG